MYSNGWNILVRLRVYLKSGPVKWGPGACMDIMTKDYDKPGLSNPLYKFSRILLT